MFDRMVVEFVAIFMLFAFVSFAASVAIRVLLVGAVAGALAAAVALGRPRALGVSLGLGAAVSSGRGLFLGRPTRFFVVSTCGPGVFPASFTSVFDLASAWSTVAFLPRVILGA
jgi:hypothetical protein